MALLQVGVAVGMLLASAAAAGSNPSPGKKAASPDAAVKYCVESEPFTGSKVIKTECKTRTEWAKEGVDVDQLAKH